MESYLAAKHRARREWLFAAMAHAGGCVSAAARLGGISRAQMYKLLSAYAPELPKVPTPAAERKPRPEGFASGGNAAWRALDPPELRD